MAYGNISAELTDEVVTSILTKMEEIRALLPFLVGLTPAERQALPKMRMPTAYFVDAALDSAQQNPNLVPPYLNLTEARKDMQLFRQLSRILAPIQQLFEAADDTTLAVGSEAYTGMLTYYNSAKRAAKDGVPGADTVVNSLKSRFAQAGSSGSSSS